MAIQYLARPRGVSPDSYGSFVIFDSFFFNYSKSIEFDSYACIRRPVPTIGWALSLWFSHFNNIVRRSSHFRSEHGARYPASIIPPRSVSVDSQAERRVIKVHSCGGSLTIRKRRTLRSTCEIIAVGEYAAVGSKD